MLLAVWAGAIPAKAQWGQDCIDSNRINPFYPCGITFIPVCGCDGKTYVNECASYNRGGVNTIAHSGVCLNDLFFYDFWPNPVTTHLNFNMLLSADQQVNGNLQVVDVFGNVVLSILLNNLRSDIPLSQAIDVNGLDTGVYLLVVQAGGLSKVRKFVKFRI